MAQLFAPTSTVYSGAKVGIRYPFLGRYWLGCAPRHKCVTASCPELAFTGKARCYGEIFRIYKKQGSGIIRIGDEVGLYYVSTAQWLSAWDSDGGVSSCPGLPSSYYGMNTPPGRCRGENFKVYAYGKSEGQALEDKDTIRLYYPHGGNEWFSLWGGTAHKATCVGATCPPPDSGYDSCRGEVFEIRKLNF